MRSRFLVLLAAFAVMLGLVVPAAGASESSGDVSAQVEVVVGAVSDPGKVSAADVAAAAGEIAAALEDGTVTAQALIDDLMPYVVMLLDWVVGQAATLVPMALGFICDFAPGMLPSPFNDVATVVCNSLLGTTTASVASAGVNAAGLVDALFSILPSVLPVLLDLLPVVVPVVIDILPMILSHLPSILDALFGTAVSVASVGSASLSDFVVTLFDSLMPVVMDILPSILDAVLPMLIELLPTIIESVLPAVISVLPDILNAVFDGLFGGSTSTDTTTTTLGSGTTTTTAPAPAEDCFWFCF